MGEGMIVESHGDLLRADAEALVNTVNTVGVMGKGIALQFKKAYPAMFDAYQRAAKAKALHLGKVQVWPTGQLTGPRFIINFPTKGHWKANSRIADIKSGLTDLMRVIRDLGITSIAVPPLGCGNGGLNWADVEPIIREAFAAVPEVQVLLFAPEGRPAAREMRTARSRPSMTPGRAALIEIIARYSEQAMSSPGLIEAQKLMYFMQEAGEPLRLRYAANLYGPYADNLRHVLEAVEGHFLSGYGDGDAHVQEAEPLLVLPEATHLADEVLATQPETARRMERVLELAEGFESPYGLELLATTHWAATHTADDQSGDAAVVELSDDAIVDQVRNWSVRKARLFTPEHVSTALSALRAEGWLPESVPA